MASTFLKNKAAEREKVVSGEKTSRASSFLRNKASERDAAVSSGSAKRTSTQNSKAPSTAPQVLPEQRTPSIDVGTWNAQRRAILNNPVLQRDEKLESIARDRVNRLMDSYDTDNAIADRIRGLEEQKRSLDGLAVPSLESAEESKRLDEQIARARAAQEARTYVPDQQLPTESAMTDKALTDRLFALELEKKNIDESPIPSLEGSARSAELSGQIDNVQDAMRARGLYAEDFDESEYYKGILETGATSTAHNVWSSIDFLANIPRRISAKISGVEYAPDEEGFFHKRSANTKKEYEAAVEKYKNNLERGGKMAEVISDLGVETINAIPMALMAFSTGGGSAALNGADVIFKSAEIPSLARTTASVISSMAKDPNFYVAFMSTVGNSYEEAIEKGASEDQAVLYALFNGVLNASLEGEYGFQAMARNPEAWTWETFVKEGMLGEAKEEITQGIVERGLENLVFNAGNKFFSTDMNDTSAVINPFTALREGASGAVIGGILSGAGMANATLRGSIQENIASNRADNVLQAVREALVSSGMNEQDARRSAPIVASLMQAGAEEQEAVSLAPAVEKALQGEAISGNDAAKIAQSDAAVSLIESVTGTEIDTDAPISEVKTAIKAFANRFEAGNETRSINPSTEESVAETGDFSAREALAPIAETLGEAGGRFLLTNAEGVADAESYAKDFVRVYNAARNNEAIPQTDLTLSQQYSAERSGKIDRAADIARGVTEENVNGGEDIRLREGSERTYGENPERQAGVLAEGAGRDQAADEGRDVSAVLGRAKDVGASQSTLSEIKNTASFGIGGGKANDVLYEVTGGFSPAMQEARNIAKKAGLRLTLYAGDYMTVRGEQIRGYVSGDRVFVRADDPEFTAAQIMKHEAGHDAIAKGEIDIKSIKESVKANLEKIGMSLDEMTALYDMAYKGSGMNADEIFEEIICDSLGNMNIFAASFSERLTAPVDQFLSIVRETVDENRQARAPTEAEARSGEPKYSAMYRNRAESFDDFYDFVLANQDDPNEINKSYYRMELKDGGAVDVPFDAIIHVENGHRISKSQYHELFDALSGQIEAAVVSNGLNRKNIVPMLLKVNTPNGKAVVVIDFNEKGRNIFKTAFFDNEVKIDNWLKEKGSRRLASKGRSSLPGNLYSVSTIQDELFGVKPDDQESKGKYSRSVSFQEEEQEIKDLESRVNELKAQQREADSARKKLEASQEYKDFLASLDNKDEAQLKKSLAEYSKWEKESGLSDAVKKREKILNELRPLESQLRDLQKDLYNKHKQEYRAKYNDEFAKKYASKAARRFGMTGRYDLAGYLTTNGSLLDFSEGQRQRTRDHREISEVLDFLPDDAAYSDGMIEFMNLGNIRLQTYGFDIAKKPNAKQVKLLRDFIRRLDGEVTVDISGENGDSLYSLEYPEGTRADRIINDLNSYFDKGIEPQISDTQRFHAEDDFYDNNTRYSRRVDDKKILDFLNNQETVKTYKTMQLVDGKLYPPMAARVKGKYEDASELGKWEEAVEHPELVKKGQFKLDKGKGQGSLDVAYNPYMHSSNLVLNDQFTGAYARNNLVTVECEVPVSETESGYKAEGAKDSVGWLPWHSGTVAGQLRAAKGIERQVLLSRWIKPVRIVPDAEVASMYKDLLDGTDIQVPDNVVTPALLAELKKAGVNIKESGRIKNVSENLNRKTELKDSAGENAVLVDDGTAMKFSRKTWSETDQKKLASDLEGMGFEKKEVNKWIGDVNSVAAFIASNSDKLDYVAAENQTAMKTDEEYIYSMDFSTLCAKRLLYQGTYNAIQHALPNYAIMPGDTLLIRHIMDEKGYEVPCGFCYVESRRKHLGKFAEKWLSEVGRKKYGIKNADVATTDGLENLRTSNPDAYEDFTAWMRQRGSANPKVVELRTAYGENTGILDLSPGTIDTLKRIGGLRIQSFSDFEIPHVIDVMQIAFDMARMGLTSQAYTKVPAFAYIFGPTGIKINLSVVADVDENGNLVFNDKEGIDHNEAFKIRDMYSDTCGTILVGKNEQQIISAMEDPRIDFIIPFHRSGWGNAEFRVLGLRGYKDFQSLQGEYNVDYSPLSPQRKKASGFLFPEDYWDYSVSGNENTVNYLNKCRELNRVPRFLCFAFDPSVAKAFVSEYNRTHSGKISVDDILTAEGMSRLCRKNKSAQAKGLRQVAFDYLEYGLDHGAKVQDGYWKTLIDFKMYDNEGNPAPQGTVRPEFNMEYARKFMSEYDKDPNNLPVAQDVVDEFVELVKNKQTDKYLRRIKDAERRADTTRFSRKADADYMKAVEAGDDEKMQELVDKAAYDAGYRYKGFHHTENAFTVFDRNRARRSMDIQGFYFSADPDAEREYGSVRYDVFLRMDNPYVIDSREKNDAIPVKFGADDYGVKVREWLQGHGYDSVIRDADYYGAEADEYIVFDPAQIKSAEPVTYSDDENGEGDVIPLSERFNENEQDIRYSRRVATFDDLKKENDSLRSKLADYEAIRKDLAAAQQRAEAAEAQLRPTTVHTVRAEDVNRLAREELKSFGSIANKQDVARRMLDLGNKIVQGEELDYNELKSDAVSIAADIVAGAQELTNSEQYEELSRVAAMLKGQRIYFDNYRGVDRNAQGYEKTDANYRSGKGEIQDYSDFRRHNFGRFTLTSDPTNARMVDDVYQELQAQFGEGLFPADITNDVDQLQYISDLLDGREKVYQNPYEYDMAEAIEFEANRILDGLIAESVRQTAPTQADKWAHKYEKLKYEDAVSKAEAVARIRQNRDEQIRRLKQAYADAAERRRERKIESAQRTRLLKIARRLSNMKLPKVSRDLIQQYIGDLDLVSKGITGQKTEKLQALRDWYEDQRENNPDFIPDSNIEKALQRLSKIQISSMTQEDVLDLTNVLLNIEHEIRTQKQLIGKEERRTVAQLGADTINDIENTKGVREGTARYALDSFFVNNTLSPLREIRRITGYKDDSPLNVAANDLADGQRKMFDFQRRAGKLFQKWTEDKAFVKMISGKDAKEITVKGKDAKGDVTVKITPAMRMSLYLHSKNEQNLRSIVDGGVTIPDIKLYKGGKYDAAYNQGRLVRFTPSQLHEIAAGMSAKEKAFADAASEYWNGMSQEEINQTSEQLKGYSLANVENYFPINRDKNFLKADFDSIKFDGTIEGMGFLKERVKAANPMLLRDMNLVLKQSIDQTAKYVGMAIPVRNWSKIWGVTKASYDTDESGKQVRTGYEGSVQQAVKRKWGQSAYDYIERMMKNVNATNVNTDDFGKMLSRVRSNYAAAVLTLNLSVSAKQAASYPTAGSVLGFRPLIRAFGNIGKINTPLVDSYTPLHWKRRQGFGSAEIYQTSQKKLPKALNWVQGADIVTTGKLWKASEYYVRQNNKNLRVGSDEYYKAVAAIYNRVIEETQPNYAVMQRPHILRSDNELVQTMMMFKTQPFQNFNILYDAFGNLAAKRAAYINLRKGVSSLDADKIKADYQQAQRDAFNATWSQLLQLAVFSGMSFGWSLLRGKLKDYKDKDKDELTLQSILSRIGKNMAGSLAAEVPFGSEAWEVASSAIFGDKYYGFDNITASSIDDLTNAFLKASESLKDIINGITSGEGVNVNEQRIAMDSVLKAVSKTVGVPYENVENLFNAVFLQSAKAAAGPYVGGYAYLRLTTDPTKYPGDFYDILYKAYKNDSESYQLIYDDMIGSGDFAEDKIKSNMEKRMKEDQGVSTVDELDSRYMSPDQQAKYDQYIAGVEGSKIWNKATEEQRDKLEENAYNLAIGSKTGSKIQEKIDKAGVSDTEYLLYTLALSITDKPTESGKYGSYTNPEVEEAINMVKGLSDDEKTALWIAQGKSEKSSPW